MLYVNSTFEYKKKNEKREKRERGEKDDYRLQNR